MKSSNQLDDFLVSTLIYIQTSWDSLKQQCHQILSHLVEMKLITEETSENPTYCITSLGNATLKGSHHDCVRSELQASSPTMGTRVIGVTKKLCFFSGCIPVDCAYLTQQELTKCQQCLVLATDLHLLFLTTPMELSASIQPNWMLYFENVISRH